MAYPRSTIRPRRRSTSSSLISKLTLVAFALIAILCFLPAGNSVRAQEKDNDYGTVIGIDLGTTYSCVA
jgi:heat shock protein 5